MDRRLRHTMVQAQILACAVAVGTFFLWQSGTLAAAPFVASAAYGTAVSPSGTLHAAPAGHGSTAARFGNCDDEEVCGPSFSCDDPCWLIEGQLPPFEITCGDYDGEPWNGSGNCLGECGDGYCNEYNDEEYGLSSCWEDCGYCGDDECQWWEGEEYGECDECGYCGDGRCSIEEHPGATGYCSQDCGSGVPDGDECDDDGECGSGEQCSPNRYCLADEPSEECTPYPNGYCLNHNDCCADEYCRMTESTVYCSGNDCVPAGVCLQRVPGFSR
jgi:hypothetical protein